MLCQKRSARCTSSNGIRYSGRKTLSARHDDDFHPGTFRVRGDVIEIYPANEEGCVIRIELFGGTVESIAEIDPLRGKVLRKMERVAVCPASHDTATAPALRKPVDGIRNELKERRFDVLVGINLLREGLDLPEVSVVAIPDADNEGYLRSLIQTIARAARNVDGTVLMYADAVTGSMRKAIDETNRRGATQAVYNEAHGITPRTIRRAISDPLVARARGTT